MSKSTPLSPEEHERFKLNPTVLAQMVRLKHGALGISQIQLCRILNISQGTLQRWERGLFDPTFVRLANLLFGEAIEVDEIEHEHLDRRRRPSRPSVRLRSDPELEMWRRRALNAEASLQEVTTAILIWRRKTGINKSHPRAPADQRDIAPHHEPPQS